MREDTITRADALVTLKHLLYETALNQFDFDTAEVFEDIAKNRIETWLDLIPPADGVEVVRCKDCIHCPIYVPPQYDKDGRCIKYGYVDPADEQCILVCEDHWYDRVPDPEFFCAKGESKT